MRHRPTFSQMSATAVATILSLATMTVLLHSSEALSQRSRASVQARSSIPSAVANAPRDFVVSGGIHGPGPGLRAQPSPVIAYAGGSRIVSQVDVFVDYEDNAVCRLGLTTQTPPPDSWKPVKGSPFAVQCGRLKDGTKTSEIIPLLRVKTENGAVTTAIDMRPKIQSAGSTDRLLDISDFGAQCDGSTDDTQAIQNAFDAAFDSQGAVVIIPDTGAPCITKWHIEVGSGTTVLFLGSYLKADGVPQEAADGACCKPGTDTDYNQAKGYRGGVLNLRRTGTRTENIVVINPLIDCNRAWINGIGVGSGYELASAGLGASAHEILVLGGTVKNCVRDLERGGGAAITTQRGIGGIRFIGTHVQNSASGILQAGGNRNSAGLGVCRIDGRECSSADDCQEPGDICDMPAPSSEYAQNVSYSSITMRNVGCAIEVLDFPTGELDDHNSWNTVISDVSCHNCGDSSPHVIGVSRKSGGSSDDAAPTDRGVICLMGGSNSLISNVNVTNEDWYPTIGAVVRGRTQSSVISNIVFDGRARSIISGEVLGPNSSYSRPDRGDPWSDNLYQNISYLGPTLDHVLDSPGERQCRSSCSNWTSSCRDDSECHGCAKGEGCTPNPAHHLRNARNRFIGISTMAEPFAGIVDRDSVVGDGVDSVWLETTRISDVGSTSRSGRLNMFVTQLDNRFFECDLACDNARSPCQDDSDCHGPCAAEDGDEGFNTCRTDQGNCTGDLCVAGDSWQFNSLRITGQKKASLETGPRKRIALDADAGDGVEELIAVPDTKVKVGVPFEFATTTNADSIPNNSCAWEGAALKCRRKGRTVTLTPEP